MGIGLLAAVAAMLLALQVTAPRAAAAATTGSHTPHPMLALHRLARIRGGSSSIGGGSGGGRGASSFPSAPFFFPPASTVPVQPPKAGSSSRSGLWGSQHLDERPLLIEPRTVDSIKQRDSRIGLIRRVFAVLSAQLFLTALVTYAFFQQPAIARFLLGPKGSWVLFLSLGVSLGSVIALGMKYSRVHPVNLLLLALFTAGESVLIGLLASMHKASAVLMAAGQAGAVTLGLSLFALLNKNRKYDLTSFGSALGGTLIIFVLSTILCTVFGFPLSEVAVGGFGAALFSLFLIYDLQRIVGGPGHEQQLDDKDYVLGCMELYLDITRLFLYILRIIAASSDSGDSGGQD